jgi:hypothetical protein
MVVVRSSGYVLRMMAVRRITTPGRGPLSGHGCWPSAFLMRFVTQRVDLPEPTGPLMPFTNAADLPKARVTGPGDL